MSESVQISNWLIPCRNLTSGTHKTLKLAKYVANNDFQRIETTIKHNYELLSTHIGHPYDYGNILLLACNDRNGMENVRGATIEKLIELGANPCEPSEYDHWEAIHYASLNANYEKLRVITKYLKPEQISSLVICSKPILRKYSWCSKKNIERSFSNNALSILLKYGNRSNQFYECCELLIEAGINVNQKDSNGMSPADLIKESEDKMLEKIFEKSCNSLSVNHAFECIAMNDEETLLTLKLSEDEANSFDGETEEVSSCTLLQLSILKGLTSCVKYLLERKASPNLAISKNNVIPLIQAIKDDHEDIVTMLLKHPDLDLPTNILIELQTRYKRGRHVMKMDKYMTLLLQHIEESSNRDKYLLATDQLQKTALHYAAFYQRWEILLNLLSMGASLTLKDIFGYTPLHYIDATVFEEFLNNCIQVPSTDNDMNQMIFSLRNEKRSFTVEINYDALIPQSCDTQESEFLRYLIKIKKFNQFLKHPVISSYMNLKWQKFKWLVYLNILFYLIAYAALLFYGFMFNTTNTVSNSFLLASLLILGFREMFQIVTLRVSYLKGLEFYVNVILLGGITYILVAGWIETLLNQNLLVAFSVVFLMATMGIFMQLGYLPFFAVKVIVLQRTSVSFIKYIIFYMFPILAFFFCFYMLAEDKEFFQTLYDTIIMFAGDSDSQYPEQFKTNPIFGHIVYVVFVILIGIILQNLLIGLAVSDLQEIQSDAELVEMREHAIYITGIERVLFQQHKEASFRIFKKLFEILLNSSSVFKQSRVLLIQPYNSGCVFLKESPKVKRYIKDVNVLTPLQNIFKDLTLTKDEEDKQYSMRMLYEKMDNIERLLQQIIK